MQLPISADPITYRKLVLAKQLFQHAVVQTSHYSASARILGLICFDLASETLMKALIASLDSARTPSDSFIGLIKQTEDLLESNALGSVPEKSKVQHVHSLRNDTQHRAKYPNETDVNDARTYTRDFLSGLCDLAWGINVESISLVDLIQHPRLTKHLAEAEAALASSDFEAAVSQAAAGLFFALGSVEAIVAGTLANFSNFVMLDSSGRPSAGSDSNSVRRALGRSNEVLSVSS
jgi:hypothetical protein